jgi:hypothetical protein
MADIRTTQEVFGDLFGGLASLGARGIDGLIIARALARTLIRKGILTEEELMQVMREIVAHEVEKNDDTQFVLETYKEILERLNEDRENRNKG